MSDVSGLLTTWTALRSPAIAGGEGRRQLGANSWQRKSTLPLSPARWRFMNGIPAPLRRGNCDTTNLRSHFPREIIGVVTLTMEPFCCLPVPLPVPRIKDKLKLHHSTLVDRRYPQFPCLKRKLVAEAAIFVLACPIIGVQGREKRFANLTKLQPGRARQKS